MLFDRLVTIAENPTLSLRPIFAAWNPADPTTYALVRSKLVVIPDKASRDVLVGGAAADWFWSDDPLDDLDFAGIDTRN